MIVELMMLNEELEETEDKFYFKNDFQFFSDHPQYLKSQHCYDCFTNGALTFRASFGGFWDNLPTTRNSTVGVGDVGSSFLGNYVGTRILTINFMNTFTTSTKDGMSPNDLLDAFINNPSQIVRVTVNEKYYIDCSFNDSTSTEGNVIILASAFPNIGSFWNGGETIYEDYIWEMSPFTEIPINERYTSNDWYPYIKEIYSTTKQPLYLKTGGEFNGHWSKVRIELNGQILEYIKNKGQYIIFDTFNRIIINELGDNLLQEVDLISGSTKLLYLKPGKNVLKITFDGQTDIHKLEYLPTDQIVYLQYNDLRNSIPEEIKC